MAENMKMYKAERRILMAKLDEGNEIPQANLEETCPDCQRDMTADDDLCGWCEDMDYDRVQDMAAETITDYSNHHLLAEDHL